MKTFLILACCEWLFWIAGASGAIWSGAKGHRGELVLLLAKIVLLLWAVCLLLWGEAVA